MSVDEAEPMDSAGETARGGSCKSARALLPYCDPGMPGDGIVRAASISRFRKLLRAVMKFYYDCYQQSYIFILGKKTIRGYLTSGREQFALVFEKLLRVLPIM